MTTKNKILLQLKAENGKWISGEFLSEKNSVSRTAIWKNIKNLKNEGYEIESSPNRGHRLLKNTDMILENEIRYGLNSKTFGQKEIAHFHKTTSTNIEAIKLADKNFPEGSIVVAENQSSGRGRKGRNWFSAEKQGIYISIILRPAIPPALAPRLTLVTAVALAKTLISETGLDAKIKWPNDVLINNKKIAGILTEMYTEVDSINHIIMGLGLNVNTPVSGFPNDIKDIATSVLIETGAEFPRIKLLQSFLQNYEYYYEIFKENKFAIILKEFKSLSNIIGKKIRVTTINRELTGIATDISEEGLLEIKTGNNKFEKIITGDIELI